MSLDGTEGPRAAAPRLDGSHSHHRSRSRGRRRQEESTSGGVITRAIKATLRFLWRCALHIFYFARFNVLLLLVVTAYACFFQGISLPIVTIKGDFMGQGSIDITKSTLESLENFFEEGFYLPGILVLLCSVVVPIVKLLMMFVIFFIRHSFPEKAHQLMFVLRIIAKYQMLDIFVTIIMVAFLNQDVMRTTLQTGFYYYLAFCLLSIGATQVLWSMLPDRPQALYAQQLARWMHDRQAEIAFKNLTGVSPGKYPSVVNNSYRSAEEAHRLVPSRGYIKNERESPVEPLDSPERATATVATTPRSARPSKRICSSPDELQDVRISRTPSFGAASEPTSFRPPTPQGSKAPTGDRESPDDDSGALVVWPAPSKNRNPKATGQGGDVSEITSVASSFNLAERKQKRSLIHSILCCGRCCHGFEFSLDTFFLYGACITFYIGLYWSLYHSVLTVKVAFKDSLIVSQSTLGLIGMIDVLVGQRGGINYIVPAVVFAVFALIIPCVQVSGIFLAGTLHVLPCHKTSHFCADTYRWLLYLIDYISDWAMMDVFSVAMFTTLISLNAFDALRADAPPGLLSGFYFLLMAGLASMDLATQTHELLMDAMARNVVEMATEMILFEQEQEESLRNAEYPIVDLGITPKSVASSIGWPMGDQESRGAAAIADRPNIVEEPTTQAILPARCYQRTLSLPTEPAGGLSFAERLQAHLNSRDGNAQPAEALPKPSSCAALTEPLLQPPPSLGAKSATATFGDMANRSEHGTDITSISRRDPSEWETFRVLRRELRRNASRVQKQASVAFSAASSPPASPKRLKDSTGDIEEGHPSPPTAVVQSSLVPATASESLVRRTKSMITLPRSRGSMVLADDQHLHPKHSLLSSLAGEQSLVGGSIVSSASQKKEKIPPVLQAAKRKVEQYVDMEAIAATPRRHKAAGAAPVSYENDGKESQQPHYRLLATDESEGEEDSNNSTADKAVPPLWKRLLQRMTGTVLIIKGVSWGIFFIVWSMHTTMPPVDLDVINLSLRGNLPLINGALQAALPSSLGACTGDSMHLAPKPCVGNSSLYYVRERVYEVNARWVSGLKTTKLDNIYLSVPAENRLALSIEGVIGELPLSLFVGQCVTPDTWFTGRCDKLWDNTDACCGTDKHFQVVLQSVCSEEYPFVRQITVENISVQQITIQEQFLGLISISLSDVTTTLQEALTKELQPFLMNNAFIPWGGATLSLGELINKILALNINRDASGHERFECPKPPVGGFGPSQYEKQGVLERTFGGR